MSQGQGPAALEPPHRQNSQGCTPMPGQLSLRASISDPAETLASTLVRPVDRRCGNDTRDLLQAPARTRLARIGLQHLSSAGARYVRACVGADQWPYQYPLLARG